MQTNKNMQTPDIDRPGSQTLFLLLLSLSTYLDHDGCFLCQFDMTITQSSQIKGMNRHHNTLNSFKQILFSLFSL